MAAPAGSGWYSSMAIWEIGSGTPGNFGFSAGVIEATTMMGPVSSATWRIGLGYVSSGKNFFISCWCMSLLYHFRTACLFSNQAKMTFLPLDVRAVSTPRQPGVAFRPLTRSGNPGPPRPPAFLASFGGFWDWASTLKLPRTNTPRTAATNARDRVFIDGLL